jgi:hypothetical protein
MRSARLQMSKRSGGMAFQTLSFGARLGPRPTVAISPMRNPAVSVVSAHCTGTCTDTDKGHRPYARRRRGLLQYGRVTATQRHSDLHALHTVHDGITYAARPLDVLE